MALLINGLGSLIRGWFEAGPGTHGQGNVVALAAGQSALAGLHAGELLEFAVKRLNHPADAAFLLSGGRVAGLDLVGHEVVRPVDGHQYAPTFQLAILRHPFYFHHFACLHYFRRPAQQADGLVRLLAARLVNEAVVLQRTVAYFPFVAQLLEQLRSGIPTVRGPRAVRNVARG